MKFMSSEENTDASMIQFYICRCVIQWTIIWKEESRDELYLRHRVLFRQCKTYWLRPNHYHKFDWKAWKELVSQDQIIDRKQNLFDWL